MATPANATKVERLFGMLLTVRRYAHPDMTKNPHMFIKASIAQVMIQRQKEAQVIARRPKGPQQTGNAKLGMYYLPEGPHQLVRIATTVNRTVAYRANAEGNMRVMVRVAGGAHLLSTEVRMMSELIHPEVRLPVDSTELRAKLRRVHSGFAAEVNAAKTLEDKELLCERIRDEKRPLLSPPEELTESAPKITSNASKYATAVCRLHEN